MGAGACKVIVVDDDAGVRDSLEALLAAKAYTAVSYDSAEAFLKEADATDEAVILMDYSMGEVSGLAAIRDIREDGDLRPVIMITAHGDIELAVAAMQAGAGDFIEKPWERDALLTTIDKAAGNARSAALRGEQRQHASGALAKLTPREHDVFERLITGASNKSVARALDLSPRTVEFYRANVFEKTGVNSVAELVRLAFLALGPEAEFLTQPGDHP